MGEVYGHPASFTDQVKDALEHIYDLGYLQNLPLAHELSARDGGLEIAGQHLRRELLAALEAIQLSTGAPAPMRQARLYNLLDLRYVQMMTLRETAQEMNVSLRQVQRDLDHAIDSLAAVLWARRASSSSDSAPAPHVSSLDTEVARIGDVSAPVAIGPLMQQAAETIRPQAALRGIEIAYQPPDGGLTVSTERLLAELALINVLSQIVEQAEPGLVAVKIASAARAPALTFQYTLALEGGGNAPPINLQITQLCDRLGWRVVEQDNPDGMHTVCIQMAAGQPVLLVIDDNEGLVELIRRYLTQHACQVAAATDAREGLQLAQTLRPDAIVLDVMMPEMHGWEVLQRLRSSPVNRDTPIIVCSVIANPKLAQALGASRFLPKPISQQDVLSALRDVGVL
ncbi:MAG: response regulator [Anaerolineales bacterium]|nr:response regulator [Anaerolineales bacterium]